MGASTLLLQKVKQRLAEDLANWSRYQQKRCQWEEVSSPMFHLAPAKPILPKLWDTTIAWLESMAKHRNMAELA